MKKRLTDISVKTPNTILRGKSGLMHMDSPKVMGVVNLTPDSFFEGSRAMEMTKVVDLVGQMIVDGVDIVDLGGMSSRPGAEEPSVSEEIDRILSPLMAVRSAFPEVWISVDTYRSRVLKECINLRIDVVNDISGGTLDEDFLPLVAKSKLPYVLMHMQGVPENMQDNPTYDDVMLRVLGFLDERIRYCRKIGIEDMIIDPGFGFGKSLDDNYTMLRQLSSFKMFDLPVLAGLSRKSMIYKALQIDPIDALNGTTALHMIALMNGANILRVHDVKEAKQCINLWQRLQFKTTDN